MIIFDKVNKHLLTFHNIYRFIPEKKNYRLVATPEKHQNQVRTMPSATVPVNNTSGNAPSKTKASLPLNTTSKTNDYLPNSNGVKYDYATTEVGGNTDILDKQAGTEFGDWRNEFFRDGYTVIKEAIPRERALDYQRKALGWFGKFPFGFDINDKSTWVNNKLPVMMKGGMILNYCAAHEKWVWEARW